jgi:hypothetical protein
MVLGERRSDLSLICESESQGRVSGLTGRGVQILRVLGWRNSEMVEATMGPYRAEGLAFTYDGTVWLMLVGNRYLLALGALHGRVSVGAMSRVGSAIPKQVGGEDVG